MTVMNRFGRRDWATAALLFVVGFALRVPFRSKLAYHWDGAQFALAVGEYDMTRGQPHAPGYFLYVMLGRLVNMLVNEPHTSLVWASVIGGAALAPFGYLLATAMFGRETGLIAGTILLTSPLCWFHSEIALTTIVDATLVTATVLVCWLGVCNRGGWPYVVAMSVLWTAVAGNRQQTAITLLPVCIYAIVQLPGRRWPKLTVGAVSVLLCGAAWFIPMVKSSGGLGAYMELLALKARFDAPKTLWGGGFGAALFNATTIADALWVGLLVAAVIAATETAYWVFRETSESKQAFFAAHRAQLIFLAIWIVPMVAFGLLAYTTMPGYVLSYFPGVTIFAAVAIRKFSIRLASQWSIPALPITIGVIAVSNSVAFLSAMPYTNLIFARTVLTAPAIRAHDRNLSRCFHAIRDRYRPADVLICHRAEFFYWGFRQFEYHLPEYRNVLLVHDSSLPGERGKQFWFGHERRTDFIDDLRSHAGSYILLVVPPGDSVEMFAGSFDLARARPLDGSGGTLYQLTVGEPHE